jgi:hypothetical protein
MRSAVLTEGFSDLLSPPQHLQLCHYRPNLKSVSIQNSKLSPLLIRHCKTSAAETVLLLKLRINIFIVAEFGFQYIQMVGRNCDMLYTVQELYQW